MFCCECFRKKKEFDWQAYVQRRIKRLAREIQVDMHKVWNGFRLTGFLHFKKKMEKLR